MLLRWLRTLTGQLLAQVSGLILRSGRVQQVYREVVSSEATQIMSGELLIIDDIAAFLQRLLCA